MWVGCGQAGAGAYARCQVRPPRSPGWSSKPISGLGHQGLKLGRGPEQAEELLPTGQLPNGTEKCRGPHSQACRRPHGHSTVALRGLKQLSLPHSSRSTRPGSATVAQNTTPLQAANGPRPRWLCSFPLPWPHPVASLNVVERKAVGLGPGPIRTSQPPSGAARAQGRRAHKSPRPRWGTLPGGCGDPGALLALPRQASRAVCLCQWKPTELKDTRLSTSTSCPAHSSAVPWGAATITLFLERPRDTDQPEGGTEPAGCGTGCPPGSPILASLGSLQSRTHVWAGPGVLRAVLGLERRAQAGAGPGRQSWLLRLSPSAAERNSSLPAGKGARRPRPTWTKLDGSGLLECAWLH